MSTPPTMFISKGDDLYYIGHFFQFEDLSFVQKNVMNHLNPCGICLVDPIRVMR